MGTKKPKFGLEKNYCRNPDGSKTAWCYTTDKKKRWEICSIPNCKEPVAATLGVACCSGPKCIGYRGTKATTITGKTCQAWNKQYPHKHGNTPTKKPRFGLEKNYCRNPDGSKTAWCYTTDKKKRWEICGIPDCKGESNLQLFEPEAQVLQVSEPEAQVLQVVKVGNLGLLDYLKGTTPTKSEFEALKNEVAKLKSSKRIKISCKTKETKCDKGGGLNYKLEYLDRQPVYCGKGEVLQKFRFRHCNRDNAKYTFDCCTLYV